MLCNCFHTARQTHKEHLQYAIIWISNALNKGARNVSWGKGVVQDLLALSQPHSGVHFKTNYLSEMIAFTCLVMFSKASCKKGSYSFACGFISNTNWED